MPMFVYAVLNNQSPGISLLGQVHFTSASMFIFSLLLVETLIWLVVIVLLLVGWVVQ